MKKLFYSILFLATAGCVQEYIPPVKPSASNYLVVEGTLNSGAGPATLMLSRTTSLDTMSTQYESGAQVLVQADDSSIIALQETSLGIYTGNDLNLNSNKKYRLKIQTANGDTYASDFVAVIPNPPIDSISFAQSGAGLQLSVNTHNPLNNTRYYQWFYKETWEFHSAYLSNLKYVITPGPSGNVYSLTPSVWHWYPPDPYDSSIYTCWQSDTSTQILVGSSATLSEDVIHLPIATITPGSQKLSVLYSIHVIQYGWSEAGYQFLQTMKKNTENTGSVFNPLPSQLTGNIHCLSNPSQITVGYFNVSPAQDIRLFISAAEVPGWNYEAPCPEFVIPNDPESIAKFGAAYLPIVANELKPIPFCTCKQIVNFFASYPACVDCTLTGTNVKPAFWP